MLKRSVMMAGAALFMSSYAADACNISARVSIVGNEFPAIQTVGAGAQKCVGADVATNLTADHQKIHLDGMNGNPAEYTTAILATSSLVA